VSTSFWRKKCRFCDFHLEILLLHNGSVAAKGSGATIAMTEKPDSLSHHIMIVEEKTRKSHFVVLHRKVHGQQSLTPAMLVGCIASFSCSLSGDISKPSERDMLLLLAGASRRASERRGWGN
jgi:hypothetical protein